MLKNTILTSGFIAALLWPVFSFSQHFTGKILLKENWNVQQSAKIKLTGAELSGSKINTANWLKATVPSTIMGVLTGNGKYNDLFVDDNYKNIDKNQFDDSWWYRRQFETPLLKHDQHVVLQFDGINYYANIWLNGKLLASRDSVYGTFRRFGFDITNLLQPKNNILAIEIFRAQPGDFNLGFVDWNPRPVDENMGIWREVSLKITGDVSLNNTYVESKVNTLTLDEASLTLKTSLKNNSPKPVNGFLTGKVENQEFRYPVTLNPGQEIHLVLSPEQIPQLYLKNPRLWWCNNLGSPELYQLDLRFEANTTITDSEKITFGVRDIEMYTNPAGHKGFKLNGKEVLIKGGGWTDDIFLRDSLQSLETQVQYAKAMNLNTLRFESIWGNNQNIYDLCDKYGLLAMVGWSCQWEWDEYLGKPCDEFGGIQTEKEMTLAIRSFRDQALWLRNHPSIFVWMVGSDKCPKPELELKYDSLFRTLDNRPYLASAGTRVSTVSGPTGVKMNGPYEYVSPNYWYIDTINGGAFGFNTETGPGPQVPVLESLRKMLPADKLWPLNENWNYHCTHSKQALNTMEVFNNALYARFGKPTNLDDYLNKSDAQSYESLKAMFEAFRVNIPKTTGIIQWMINSAWPSLYWQLYDYYLAPTAAYYAARTANQPLQLIYNYGDNAVYAVNESRQEVSNYSAAIKLLNTDSKELLTKVVAFSLGPNSSKRIFALDTLKETAFLDLNASDAQGRHIAGNFYWLSHKQDVYAWDKTTWVYTPLKAYTDFSGLNSLPPSEVVIRNSIAKNGNSVTLTAHLTNPTSKIAFFVRLALLDKQGNLINPVFWDDNYISLLPGEKRDVNCSIPLKSIEGVSLQLTGWNIKKQVVGIE